MKKILIDVNSTVPYFMTGRVSGIGRTTVELVRALGEMEDLPFDIELYSQNMKGVGAHNFDVPFKKRHLYVPKRDNFDKLVSKIHLRELMSSYDLLHIPHNFDLVAYPERTLITMHDTIYFSHPDEFFNHNELCDKYSKLAKQCKGIITCSESSKRDIVKYMGMSEDRIDVIYWGYNETLFIPRQNMPNHYCGDNPYYMTVSSGGDRKNTISIVKGFCQYAQDRSRHHLIIIWASPTQEVLEKVKRAGVENRVHFISGITDKELANLYASATASLFLSLYEGFGLPILESIASGTPVITCRNSSLQEVGGDVAIYVDPFDINQISESMKQLEDDIEYRHRNKERLLKQARKFSWKKCAEQTASVYKKYLDKL